jgi:ADP-ribose pyrophosphatase
MDATVHSSRCVFSGRVLRLVVDRVELPNGVVKDLEVVRHPGAAAIVPLTEDNLVLMVRQFRYPLGDWLLEVPAGTLEPGESAEACAAREVTEEVGYVAVTLVPLGSVLPAPGYTDERIALYLARGLTPAQQGLDDDENLSVERLPFEEAVRRARSGEIEDAKSVIALLRAAQWLEESGERDQG